MTRSILIFAGFDGLGDTLQRLPILKVLRDTFSPCHITWLSRPGSIFHSAFKPLADDLLDMLITDIDIAPGLKNMICNPLKGTALYGRQFDYVFDLNTRLNQALVLRWVKTRCFISSAANYRLSQVKPASTYAMPSNVTQRLLDMVSLVTQVRYEPNYQFAVPAVFHERAAEFLPDDRAYIGFVPCGINPNKKWPIERFIALAQQCVARGFCPVFFLGPDEQAERRIVEARLPSACIAPLMKEHGGVYYYLALGQRLRGVITNDSGPGHLLNASGARIIFLFGPTNAKKFAPVGDRVTVIHAQSYGSREMTSIPVRDVVDLASQQFDMDHGGVSPLLLDSSRMQ